MLKSSSNTKESKEESNLTKSKRKRVEDKKESKKIFVNYLIDSNEVQDLMKRIINYLLYISKNIDNFQIENNKELLIKVFEYLKDYKLNNPIDFLKVLL